jgi:hypothetical protein
LRYALVSLVERWFSSSPTLIPSLARQSELVLTERAPARHNRIALLQIRRLHQNHLYPVPTGTPDPSLDLHLEPLRHLLHCLIYTIPESEFTKLILPRNRLEDFQVPLSDIETNVALRHMICLVECRVRKEETGFDARVARVLGVVQIMQVVRGLIENKNTSLLSNVLKV